MVRVGEPGADPPPLKSVQVYNKGGTGMETANGGARARSAAVIAWERNAGRTYGTTAVFFRYDPATDALLGTVKLRHTLELSRDGDSFTGFSVPEFRDPAGNLQPGSNPAATPSAARGSRSSRRPTSRRTRRSMRLLRLVREAEQPRRRATVRAV